MGDGLGILYVCSSGGLLIIVGSLMLLLFQRASLDKETKQEAVIKLPLGIEIKSTTPVIVLMALGAALLIYSAYEVRQFNTELTVNGNLTGESSQIEVYASVASAALPSNGKFSFPVPSTHPPRKYMLLYTVNGGLLASQYFDPATDLKDGLPEIAITIPKTQRFAGEIQPAPIGY
jgi:hypothetical protein